MRRRSANAIACAHEQQVAADPNPVHVTGGVLLSRARPQPGNPVKTSAGTTSATTGARRAISAQSARGDAVAVNSSAWVAGVAGGRSCPAKDAPTSSAQGGPVHASHRSHPQWWCHPPGRGSSTTPVDVCGTMPAASGLNRTHNARRWAYQPLVDDEQDQVPDTSRGVEMAPPGLAIRCSETLPPWLPLTVKVPEPFCARGSAPQSVLLATVQRAQ